MELQKASVWKRISAWLFDNILLVIFAVLFGFALSGMLGYDKQCEKVDKIYADYESRYGITFDITAEEYEALSQEKKDKYDEASKALSEDEEAITAYNMVVNLTLIITSLGIFLSVAGLEFVVPLLFGHGRTIGKRVFGIALVRQDGVKINPMQLTVRTLLGKYTVGTMVPVLVFIMLMLNVIGSLGTFLLMGLLLAQTLCLTCTQNKVGLGDLMAGTVPVEMNSQRIFETETELIEYKKKIHAEQVAQQDY